MNVSKKTPIGVWKPEIKSLSEQYGQDFRTTWRIFKKINQSRLLISSNHLEYLTPLHEAFQFLKPKKVMDFFKNEDLVEHGRRKIIFDYTLNNPDLPVCGFNELKKITAEFRTYLENNRSSLLKKGFPKYVFSKSRFFEREWAKLYYTRVPQKVRSIKNHLFGRKYIYRWSSEMSSQLTDELGESGRKRIESERGKIFDIKTSIMDSIIKYLGHKNSSQFWKDSLDILTNALSYADITFYLEVDKVYRKRIENIERIENTEVDFSLRRFGMEPGGISDIFSLVYFFENEVKFGMWTTLSKLRNNFYIKNKKKPTPRFESYFEILPYQGLYNQFLNFYESYFSLHDQSHTLWEQYNKRVHKAVDEEFSVPYTYNIKRKHKPYLEIHLKSYIEQIELSELKSVQKVDWPGTRYELAKHLRTLKEKGAFKSYTEAYRYGYQTYTIKGKPIQSPDSLKKAFESAANKKLTRY